ncbi:LysR family transcriptional regulator [Brevibacterium samyangense]|uniref:LysR family transcriptional regulator n=1 Tax=Brevibacterium samyangense TaxID=366888 RepID=A0ABP5EPG3_9MICO
MPHSYAQRRVSADDLLTLLAVARLGKFTAAAHSLGINHTTVSRRIAGIEKALGDRVLVNAPEGWELTQRGRELLDVAEEIEAALGRVPTGASAREALRGTVRLAAPIGFCVQWAAEAAVALQRRHPAVQVEIISATHQPRQYRSGVDLEIVVGKPDVPRSLAYRLREYRLALFATDDYFEHAGIPETLEDLGDHRLIYYIEHALGVPVLDAAGDRLPEPAGYLRSNSMIVHVEATRAGGGIGLLPTYMAERYPELLPVLPHFGHTVSYWASVRPEALRSPGTRALLEILREG